MGPKKKGGKKAANDDWDEGLGEAVDPIAAATQQAKDEEATQDAAGDDEEMGGGLLATLKKNRKNKQKKGKAVEDFVDGEDPPGVNGSGADGEALNDLSGKAPQEADADDLFDDVPAKKGKGGKGAQQKKTENEAPQVDDEEEDGEGGGRVKTKKEKEREKKEKEKQRKKEQVSWHCQGMFMIMVDN